MTALEPTDVLVEIQIPRPGKHSGGAYHKVERKVGDYATAGVAVYLELDDGVGTCGKEGQSVPVGVGQPTLKIDELTVGGTA